MHCCALAQIRTAVGLAVAAIAKWDCPDAWPDLLDNLLRAIDQRDNPPLGEEFCKPAPWFSGVHSPNDHGLQADP